MDTREEVKRVIEKIRSALQADGGDIELIDIEGEIVKVKLRGACAGCPLAQMTLKGFVEDAIKRNVSGIEKVEAV
ncbi:MAG: NifU family protein [Candidatus Altiarchaeales archaeon]|nr:MAG: NifU family protein [Candidatus Altiarchaeales archaeon]